MKTSVGSRKMVNSKVLASGTYEWFFCLVALWGFISCSVSTVENNTLSLNRCPELLYAAQDALEKEKFFEAEFYALKCLEEDPASSSALDMLGLTYLKRGAFERAKLYFEAIQKVDPDYEYLHHRLSLVNFSLQNFEDSRKHFLIAYDLYPIDPQTQALKKLLEEEGLINEFN